MKVSLSPTLFLLIALVTLLIISFLPKGPIGEASGRATGGETSQELKVSINLEPNLEAFIGGDYRIPITLTSLDQNSNISNLIIFVDGMDHSWFSLDKTNINVLEHGKYSIVNLVLSPQQAGTFTFNITVSNGLASKSALASMNVISSGLT